MKTTILTLAFASITVGLPTPAVAEESMGKYILTPNPSPEPRHRQSQIHFLHSQS